MDRTSIGEHGMVSTLLVVVDGLRASDVQKMPLLTELAQRGVSYRQARSVAPSLTRPAAASLAGGAPPGVTGIAGNRLWADGHLIDTGRPDHLELLRSLRGDRLLPVPTLGEHLADHGARPGLRDHHPATDQCPDSREPHDPAHAAPHVLHHPVSLRRSSRGPRTAKAHPLIRKEATSCSLPGRTADPGGADRGSPDQRRSP
ncbi:alkaline phosphatase family protein [Streptomyces asiaticus]